MTLQGSGLDRGRLPWRRLTLLAVMAAPVGGWGCGAPDGSDSLAASRAERITESSSTATRVDGLRARFAVANPRFMPAAGVAGGFEIRDGALRAVIPPETKRGVTRTASVALPVRASDPVRLEDDASHVAVSFALRGASPVAVTTARGVAMYPGALAGADVIHRVTAEGTEDYVVFEQRPDREAIAYDVDVSRVAGLRLVSDTLEFLDAGGAPRLRVAPPRVVDAANQQQEAVLAVDGCAVDASPEAPWGRAVTAPGAAHCTVRVAWKVAAYPALLDPGWTATGSMASARIIPAARLLGSDKVLVAGGLDGGYGLATSHALSSAELYDPATGTFGATGAMATPRYYFTATALASGKVLVAGGATSTNGAPTPSAELYDPATGTFSTTGSMATARMGLNAARLDSGKVLVAGGWNGDRTTPIVWSSAEIYDPAAGTFTATGSETTAHSNGNVAAPVLGSGKVLVEGGNDGSGNGGFVSVAELYDPASGSWAATGSLATPRDVFTATLLGSGKVLVAGGYCEGNDAGDCTGAVASAELYDPATGTFGSTGSLTTPRFSNSATLLVSGQVLFAGGAIDAAQHHVTSSTELYDPVTGVFTATSSMTTPRENHTATLLGSGEVLLAGGWNGHSAISSAELYTPGLSDGGVDAGDGGVDAGPDSGADAGAKPARPSSGCSCRMAEPRNVSSHGLLWLGVAGVFGLRMIRRRREALALRLMLAVKRTCSLMRRSFVLPGLVGALSVAACGTGQGHGGSSDGGGGSSGGGAAGAGANGGVAGSGGNGTFTSSYPGDAWEGETHIAVGTNGYVAAVWIGSNDANWKSSFIGYAFSTDSGSTWMPVQAIAPVGQTHIYDPAVAVDAANNFYVSFGSFDVAPSTDCHIWVETAPAGTTSFGTPSEVNDPAEGMPGDAGVAPYWFDKPWIAVTKSQQIIVTYARLDWQTCPPTESFWPACKGSLVAARSKDAKSWKRAQIAATSAGSNGMSDTALALAYPCASRTTGRLWVVYNDNARSSAGVYSNGVVLQYSDDDGDTWSAATTVAPMTPTGIFDDPSCAGDGSDVWVAYELAWVANVAGSIQVAHSGDGGQKFDAAVNVLDTTASTVAWHSSIALESDGHLDVEYYGGASSGDKNAAVFFVRSANQGATWGKATLIKEPITLVGHAAWSDAWLGDYLGVTTAGGSLYTTFTDNSTGVAHVDFAKMKLP